MQKLTRWMRHNPEGGLVVFMTSDTDFLKDVNAVVENYNFKAELIFHGDNMSKAPGMREKVNSQGHCHEWMQWLRETMRMPQLQMHPFDKHLEWATPSDPAGSRFLLLHALTFRTPALCCWSLAALYNHYTKSIACPPREAVVQGLSHVSTNTYAGYGVAGRINSGASGSQGAAGAGGSGRAICASHAAVSDMPRRGGAAVLEAPKHATSQPAQPAGAKMSGFPPHAAPQAVMSIVHDIMFRMPHLCYSANFAEPLHGLPVVSLTLSDLGSAKQAVQQLHGQRHGIVTISMELDSYLQLQPLSHPPHPHAAGTSQSQAGLQPVPRPPPPPPRMLPTSNAVPCQANQQPYSTQATGSASGHSSSGQARVPQPFWGHASCSQAGAGQATFGHPTLAAFGSRLMSGQPSGSAGSGRITACVQQSSDRPKLIQQIQEQFNGDSWETCKEFVDLKVKLNKMQVFCIGLFSYLLP